MTRAEAFRAALLDPAQAVPQGLTDPAGRPAGKRFDVYRNNVVVSLRAALETGFPVMRKLLGPDAFAGLADAFLRAYPPASPVLADYGAALPGFLEQFPPLAGLPYLADVARLEMALRESYHAADAAPIAPERLTALPPDRLGAVRLRLAPSLRIVVSDWPVVGIWQRNAAGGPRPVTRAEAALVTRPEFDPQVDLLPSGAPPFLRAILEERPLAEAAAEGARSAGFDLAAVLRLLHARRAITSFVEERCDV